MLGKFKLAIQKQWEVGARKNDESKSKLARKLLVFVSLVHLKRRPWLQFWFYDVEGKTHSERPLRVNWTKTVFFSPQLAVLFLFENSKKNIDCCRVE